MSAFWVDMCSAQADVRFVPIADIGHLVGMSALHGFACSTVVREFAAVGLRTTDLSQN